MSKQFDFLKHPQILYIVEEHRQNWVRPLDLALHLQSMAQMKRFDVNHCH